jgi:diacylglycerol kinase
MVWITEIYNTALERLINLVHPEWGQAAGTCKDISAAGVILSALISIIVGLLIFGPPLYRAAAAVLNY